MKNVNEHSKKKAFLPRKNMQTAAIIDNINQPIRR
jgi:hypothetical protein